MLYRSTVVTRTTLVKLVFVSENLKIRVSKIYFTYSTNLSNQFLIRSKGGKLENILRGHLFAIAITFSRQERGCQQ